MRFVPALTLGVVLFAAPALASTVGLYKIGCGNAAWPGLDASNTPLACSSEISWTDLVGPGPIGPMTLAITAEGVDSAGPYGGERDAVYVNGNFVGFLAQQGFYWSYYNLRPGPGGLTTSDGLGTALTTSLFDVTPYLVNGLNSFTVVVDPDYWVNEIEVATLGPTPVPEPATLALLGTGLAACWRTRRRRR